MEADSKFTRWGRQTSIPMIYFDINSSDPPASFITFTSGEDPPLWYDCCGEGLQLATVDQDADIGDVVLECAWRLAPEKRVVAAPLSLFASYLTAVIDPSLVGHVARRTSLLLAFTCMTKRGWLKFQLTGMGYQPSVLAELQPGGEVMELSMEDFQALAGDQGSRWQHTFMATGAWQLDSASHLVPARLVDMLDFMCMVLGMDVMQQSWREEPYHRNRPSSSSPKPSQAPPSPPQAPCSSLTSRHQ
ncbi:hypothetical protein V8C86DRAFT_2724294 [Haematococcus lacustris]